jgi:hypothetical protein
MAIGYISVSLGGRMASKLNPAVLFPLIFILLMPGSSLAQQSQLTSVDEMKRQIAKLEVIENDPGTPPEVKHINRTFLDDRRTSLRRLLNSRRNALLSYLASGSEILMGSEVNIVEGHIRVLEAELKNLPSDGQSMSNLITPLTLTSARTATPTPNLISTEAIDIGVIPGRSLPAQPQCADLISNVVIATSSAQRTLEVILRVPLSLSNQPFDVTRVVNQLSIPASHFTIVAQDGTTSITLIPAGTISTISGTGRKGLRINLMSPIPTSTTTIVVTLKNLAFECPNASSPSLIETISKTGEITTNALLLATDTEALNKAIKEAAAKRSSDKNFRLGFSATKGDGEQSDGAADISINRRLFGGENSGTVFDFFDQADLALQLKKSSAMMADPRHLTLGLNLRKTFLVFSQIKQSDVSQITRRAAEQNIRSKGFFRVLMINEGLNLEGEAFDFKTTNFISDTHVELASIAKRLGSGFYNMNLFVGPELGRNLSKPDAATAIGATSDQLGKVNWVTRLKAGGQFTLRLIPTGRDDNWGVELDLGYVNRRLFSNEVFTQETMKDGQTIKKLVTVGEGNRAWRQADLKVFLFGNQSTRYGVKFSYTNGQLPPAFTPTKSFQFGLIVESSDDKRGGESVNKP